MAELLIGLPLLGVLLILIWDINWIVTDWPDPLWFLLRLGGFVGGAWSLGWAFLKIVEWSK